MNQTKAATGLAACLLLAAPHAARTQSLGDAQAGHTLARTWCSHCHAVEPATPPRSSDVAPGFTALARNPAITSRALHVLLGTSHGQMPDYRLTPRQIDDISAYVLSLKPAAPAH